MHGPRAIARESDPLQPPEECIVTREFEELNGCLLGTFARDSLRCVCVAYSEASRCDLLVAERFGRIGDADRPPTTSSKLAYRANGQ